MGRCTARFALHLLVLFLFWFAIFAASLSSPPLLDDADATHAQAAQAVLHTGDWVTLHVDGVRYLEKAPLPYWLAALSLWLFGENAFAIHLPLALAVLGLAALGYDWGRSCFDAQTAFYTALFFLTSVGPFLFTRIFIPEALLSLFLVCGLYALFRTLEPQPTVAGEYCRPVRSEASTGRLPGLRFPVKTLTGSRPYALLFWFSMALALLTKGLIAIVFLLGTAALFLTLTRSWNHWRALHPGMGVVLFLAVAAPWHILAGLRNQGVAGGHGFFWFYFVNEHVLRFLGRRVPRDYNKLPALLYWLLHLVWLFPWSCFAPVAAVLLWRKRRTLFHADTPAQRTFVLLSIFCSLVLAFFSFSTNQEYYTFPVYLPLLLLLAAAVHRAQAQASVDPALARMLHIICISLVVVGALIALALAYGLWQARHLHFVPDIGTLLDRRSVGNYTLSLSRFFDLTGPSFAALRLPAALALAAFLLGPAAAMVLHRHHREASVIHMLGVTSAVFLIAAHLALGRFSPVLSSRAFAQTILQLQRSGRVDASSQVLILGDQAFGSSLPFYLQRPVNLVDGRSSSMLFGSTFPDVPPIFLSPAEFQANWGHGARKLFFVPAEQRDAANNLLRGRPQILVLQSSGKELLTDRPLSSPGADPPSAALAPPLHIPAR